MTMLDTPNPERNAEFEAWVASLPAKSWAKYDLSACRLGWDAALSSIPEQARILSALAPSQQEGVTEPEFKPGDRVQKKSGSEWHGRVCGTYSTELTPKGYCVESEREKNSVQNYPVAALEAAPSHPAAVGPAYEVAPRKTT